jgi:hypothetical protein
MRRRHHPTAAAGMDRILLEKSDDPGHARNPIFPNFTQSGHGELFAAAGNMTDNQRLRR